MKSLICVVAISSLLVSACASKETCDPSLDANVFQKLGCTVSGSYAERLSDKEKETLKLEEQRDMLLLINEELEKDRAITSNNLKERKKALNSIKQKVAKLQSDLQKKNALKGEIKKSLDDVQKQLATMNTVKEDTSLIELEEQKSDLEQELNTLMSNM